MAQDDKCDCDCCVAKDRKKREKGNVRCYKNLRVAQEKSGHPIAYQDFYLLNEKDIENLKNGKCLVIENEEIDSFLTMREIKGEFASRRADDGYCPSSKISKT